MSGDGASELDRKPGRHPVKGRLYTWGLAKSGQLGTGKKDTEHTPQLIKLGSGADNCLVYLSCGGLYSAVITHNGDMFTTGCGKYGRLGTGNEEDSCVFVKVTLPEKVTQVSCGMWHGAAVTLSGGLLVWGYRKACAPDSSTSLSPPTLLIPSSQHKITGVSCGNNFTLVWTEEGKVLSWGSGSYGVLGHGSTDDVATPCIVKALEGKVIVHASAGFTNSGFVTSNGEVYMCGKGKDGALGLGKKHLSDISTPSLVSLPAGVQACQVSCSVGEHHGHTLALTADGQVYSWGDGYKGKLGLDSQDSAFTPTLISPTAFNNERVAVVCAGGIHSTAATDEGSVYTWGCGSDGRMGHPEGQGHRYLFRSDVPKKVESLVSKGKYVTVSCSYYHTAAIVD